MAVNYVKGQILSSVLERDGIDLSIANANVGINTASPTATLEVVGNVKIGNVLISNIGSITANTASITGNITVGNLSTAGNVATGNLLTDNLLYANGVPWDLQQPAGANTEIQFNDNNNFGANVNFTFDTAGNLLTVNATANIANLNVQGNVTGGNILTIGIISATGDITTSANIYATNFFGNVSGNITAPGSNGGVVFNDNGIANSTSGFTFDKASNAVSVSGNITSANVIAVGDVTGTNFYGTGVVSVTGNISGGNLDTAGLISASGNVTGGNLITGGQVSATGNITGGNLITGGTLTATGNISTASNILGGNIATTGTVSATGAVTAGGFTTVGNVTAGNVLFGAGTVSGTGDIVGGNIFGNIVATIGNIANLRISNTTITTDGTIGNIVLQPTGTGLVVIDANTGLVVPVGNTAQRPSPATQGTIRFNTQTLRVEVYDGTEWDTIVGGVTNQILYGDGSTTTFTLDRSTTTAAVLVMLNGITQIPGQAYSMSPSPSVNLVFTEAPQTSDTIDIRFL